MVIWPLLINDGEPPRAVTHWGRLCVQLPVRWMFFLHRHRSAMSDTPQASERRGKKDIYMTFELTFNGHPAGWFVSLYIRLGCEVRVSFKA